MKIIILAVNACLNEAIPIKGLTKVKANLPTFKKRHRVYPYLKDEEADKVLSTLLSERDQFLSYRDRAIGIMFFFTGIRREDLAAFRLEYIDWQSNTITYYQSKNGTFNSIPLRPVVGNALYDYMIKERPQAESEYMFLFSDRHPRRLKGGSIYDILDKIFRLSGVRVIEDRKGTHIFRHHLTRMMIEHKSDIRIVTDILGHSSASSIDPYLQSDFRSLKECALSIELYPLRMEVLL